MRIEGTLGWIATAAAALALASPAAAKQFSMTGSWIVRDGPIFVPFQFPLTANSMTRTWRTTGTTAQGGPLNSGGFPNGPIVGGGVVSASGGTTSIMVPQELFESRASGVFPFFGSTAIFQITTMLGIAAPLEPATLAKGGGPGSFTWCPTNPACTAAQPLAGIGRGNARVIYREGANRFGGTMRIGLEDGGTISFWYTFYPPQLAHAYWIAPDTLVSLAVGGGAADLPAVAKAYLTAAVVTQPLATPKLSIHLVTQPGGRLTTGMGITTQGATGPILRFPIGTTPGGMSFGGRTTRYGFPHTTGTVIAQQTGAAPSAGDDFFTLMGYDHRGPNGAGNIATVAGGITFRTTRFTTFPQASIHKTWLQLRSPVPTLSPTGLAAAAALVLLAAGYALSRRR